MPPSLPLAFHRTTATGSLVRVNREFSRPHPAWLLVNKNTFIPAPYLEPLSGCRQVLSMSDGGVIAFEDKGLFDGRPKPRCNPDNVFFHACLHSKKTLKRRQVPGLPAMWRDNNLGLAFVIFW